MASDDLTKKLPDEERTTQPTIITVLERMKAFEARMEAHISSKIDSVESSLREEMHSLRDEMNRNFRRLENKIELLNDDILTMREKQRDAVQRIGDLESKAS